MSWKPNSERNDEDSSISSGKHLRNRLPSVEEEPPPSIDENTGETSPTILPTDPSTSNDQPDETRSDDPSPAARSEPRDAADQDRPLVPLAEEEDITSLELEDIPDGARGGSAVSQNGQCRITPDTPAWYQDQQYHWAMCYDAPYIDASPSMILPSSYLDACVHWGPTTHERRIRERQRGEVVPHIEIINEAPEGASSRTINERDLGAISRRRNYPTCSVNESGRTALCRRPNPFEIVTLSTTRNESDAATGENKSSKFVSIRIPKAAQFLNLFHRPNQSFGNRAARFGYQDRDVERHSRYRRRSLDTRFIEEFESEEPPAHAHGESSGTELLCLEQHCFNERISYENMQRRRSMAPFQRYCRRRRIMASLCPRRFRRVYSRDMMHNVPRQGWDESIQGHDGSSAHRTKMIVGASVTALVILIFFVILKTIIVPYLLSGDIDEFANSTPNVGEDEEFDEDGSEFDEDGSGAE